MWEQLNNVLRVAIINRKILKRARNPPQGCPVGNKESSSFVYIQGMRNYNIHAKRVIKVKKTQTKGEEAVLLLLLCCFV